jgi:hypothetical protein
MRRNSMAQEQKDEQQQQESEGITIARDDFGRSDIQDEAEQPIGASGGLTNASDAEAPGGSSSMHTQTASDASARHRQPGSAHLDRPETSLSRGEAFDQAQGGGRDAGSVD